MKEVIGIRFGHDRVHPINEDWFTTIGINKTYPFNIFTSKQVLRWSPLLNQFFGFLHSLFLPNAKTYILTSTGCMSSVILKKYLFNSKVIVINSDTFYRDLNKTKGIKKLYMLWLVSYVDGMISTSYLVKDLTKKYISKNILNEVVYLYANINKFSKVNPTSFSKNICSIGMGINTKGTDILFEVFKIYSKEYPNSKLYLCGDVKDIKGLSVPENVILTGVVNPSIYLEKAGVYLNTSRHESFGVNILEAMVASNLVLASNRCGASEILKKIDKDLIINLNPKDIAKILITFQKNDKKKKIIIKKSKMLALTFTKESSLSEFKKSFISIQNKFKKIK